MPSPKTTRRDDLLNASIDFILQNGVADLSLRPLAAAVGSKARLLIYHFGSKDSLVAEAMVIIRDRVQRAFADIVSNRKDRTPGAVMHTFWEWATDSSHQQYLRLFFEVHGLALQKPDPYDRYLKGSVSTWVDMMTTVLPAKLPIVRRRAFATLAVGSVVGLLLEFLSSEEKQNSVRALDLFAGSFDAFLEFDIFGKQRSRKKSR
jgi:AcrR family transcriptional regulator